MHPLHDMPAIRLPSVYTKCNRRPCMWCSGVSYMCSRCGHGVMGRVGGAIQDGLIDGVANICNHTHSTSSKIHRRRTSRRRSRTSRRPSGGEPARCDYPCHPCYQCYPLPCSIAQTYTYVICPQVGEGPRRPSCFASHLYHVVLPS